MSKHTNPVQKVWIFFENIKVLNKETAHRNWSLNTKEPIRITFTVINFRDADPVQNRGWFVGSQNLWQFVFKNSNLPCFLEEFARANYSGGRIFQKNQKLCHFISEFMHSNLEFFGTLSEISLEFKWNSSRFFVIHGISREFRIELFCSIISSSDCGIARKTSSARNAENRLKPTVILKSIQSLTS